MKIKYKWKTCTRLQPCCFSSIKRHVIKTSPPSATACVFKWVSLTRVKFAEGVAGVWDQCAYLQRVLLSVLPVQRLAVVGEVDHGEGHGRGHGCHQHGLHHLQTRAVDVPVMWHTWLERRLIHGLTEPERLGRSLEGGGLPHTWRQLKQMMSGEKKCSLCPVHAMTVQSYQTADISTKHTASLGSESQAVTLLTKS